MPSLAITLCTPVVERGIMNLTLEGIAPVDVDVVVATVAPS